MRTKHLIISLLAVAALFTGCKEEIDFGLPEVNISTADLAFDMEGGSNSTVTVNATRDWTASTDVDWIAITPSSGKAYAGPETVTIRVLSNEAYDRSASVLFNIGFDYKTLTVNQAGARGSADAAVVYYNDFDKVLATSTFGSGTSWPYFDQFDGWKNETGSGASTVDYGFSGLSARANSESSGSYSDYDGSGKNNVFFGGNGFLWVKEITLPDGVLSYGLSFGTEMYDNANKNTPFNKAAFHVYISNDASKWVELNYDFTKSDAPVDRWDLAAATFNVPEGTGKLHIYIRSDIASVFRLDDLKVMQSLEAGPEVDFESGITIPGTDPNAPVPEERVPSADDVFYNDFDKTVATNTYGSGTSWPYLDQFDGWKNQVGTGAASVDYAFNGLSARANSTTDGDYSLYPGSGNNNIFFGTNGWMWVKNITLPEGKQNFTLAFGSEKYDNNNKTAPFSHEEFHVYVSDTGAKWVELNYTFAQGADPVGKYDLASSSFAVPSGTSTLHVYVKCDVASQYRMDDLWVYEADAPATLIDFASGIEIEGTGGGDTPEPPAPSGEKVYFNDFDKTVATNTFGSGSSWPYLDQFDGWKNETGTGASTVDYAFNGLSARSNSATDSNYSLYAGSGKNNIFFGTNGWLWVKDITLPDGKQDFKLSFGSEKYDSNNKTAPFSHSEFHVYVSDTGAKWVELSYSFAQGSDPVGKYDLASSSFTVPSGTAKLHVYIKCDVASQYRLDDLGIEPIDAAGTAIDFSTGIEIEGTGGGDTPEPPTPEVEKVYYNDFDKTVATNTYGSGSSWPYLDQFDGWKNETGTGASSVDYAFNGISARANSATDSDYSLYEGSGKNNLFFGTDAWLWVKDITLPDGKQNFKLSFGSEKYDNNNKTAPFSHEEFHVYVSDTGAKWVELSYTFAQGSDPVAKYDLASSSFTVPSGTAKLHVYIKCDVASQYRLDDLGIEPADAAGTDIDFSSGIEIEGTGGGGDTPPEPPTPEVKDPVEVSLAGFLAAEASEDQPYSVFGKVGEISDPAHGAIVLTDGTTSINVLSISATDLGYGSDDDGSFTNLGVSEGDKVRIIGFKVKDGDADALAYAYLVNNYGAPVAKTVKFAISAAEWKATSELSGGYEATYDNVLFGYYKGDSAAAVAEPYLTSDPAHIRVVKYATLKIVPPEGCFVTDVVLKTPSKNYVKEPVAENGEFTLDDETEMTITWKGCMSPFVAETDGGQVRITEFTVTYE